MRATPILRCLLLLAWVLGLSPAWGQLDNDQQLKAAFLVNFLKYVEWPTPGTQATICLFGRDSLGPFLAGYEGRTISGRELRIRRITGPDPAADCKIVFIPEAEEARLGAVLRWTDKEAVLTVSDVDFFVRQGGGIGLVRAEGRLQFEVNTDVLAKAGLKPSSQMMRLARPSGSAR